LSYSRIILAFILVNAAGITLRYFELDTYFIFVGFRFHLGCILPFILLLRKENISELWESLRKPLFRKKIIPVFWLFSSLAVVFIVLYFLRGIKPGDPDYFYEFGLSSVFDYPLYLAWNFPQMCMLFMVLTVFAGGGNIPFIKVFTGLVLLFGFEFVPLGSEFSFFSAGSFILLSLTASFFTTKLQNIYWFSFIIFSSVWSIVLLFGSGSEVIINLFFAREYSSWEGFFKAGKQYSLYVIPLFLFVLLIITAFYSNFLRKKTPSKNQQV